MILENVFFTEIELEKGNLDEFVEKGWYALNVHTEYPEEEVGNNAFLDWARDLFWIKQNHIVIVVKGNITDDVKEIIDCISEFWDRNLATSNKEDYKKKVDFILLG